MEEEGIWGKYCGCREVVPERAYLWRPAGAAGCSTSEHTDKTRAEIRPDIPCLLFTCIDTASSFLFPQMQSMTGIWVSAQPRLDSTSPQKTKHTATISRFTLIDCFVSFPPKISLNSFCLTDLLEFRVIEWVISPPLWSRLDQRCWWC